MIAARQRLPGVLAVLSLLACVALVLLWMWPGEQHQWVWLTGVTPHGLSNRHALFYYNQSIGYAFFHGWSYRDAYPDQPPIGGFRIPVGTMVLLLLIMPGHWLYLRVRVQTPAEQIEALHSRIDRAWTWAGAIALAWFLLGWQGFSGNHSDDPEILLAGAIGISVPVIVIGLGLSSLRARRKRTNSTLCRKCGYDLRATAQRCPECGTQIRTSSAKMA